MAADPRIPATAPTTQAAPKLGRSIAAIVPPLESVGKFLHGLLPSDLSTVTGFANAACFLPTGVLWRPFVPVLAMGSGQARDPRSVSSSAYLRKVNTPTWPQRLFYRFASSKPLLDGVALHTTVPRPLRERLGASFDGELAVALPIVHLFFAGRPFTVFGRIGAIVVDTLKRHAYGRRSHVGKELLKPHPSGADLDAAPAVPMEGVVVRIKTPLFHAAPSVVARRTAHAVRHIGGVKCIRSPRGAAPVFAATRNRLAAAKMIPAHCLCRPAIAANMPIIAPISAALNGQQSERLSKHFGHCVALPHSQKECNHAV